MPGAGRVKGSNEEARTINAKLDKINVKLTRIIDRMIDEEESCSANDVKDRFLGRIENKHSLIELFELHNKRIKEQIGNGYASGTLQRYNTTLKHLKGYLKKFHHTDDVFVEDLNYSFIADFEYYFKVDVKLSHNTATKYLRNFKKIVILALKNEWILRDPFMRFKMSLNEVVKEYLTKEELEAITEKELEIDRLDQIRDVFIFCCYTGLAYADVQRLTHEDISIGLDGEYWVFIQRKKTGVESNIPLLPAAARLIEKYKDHPVAISNGRVLPVLSNQKINSYLKEIGDLCGINKNITFHMARHTFATTITLSNGVSMESVSQMLGHKNIRTTQIYAKVVKEKVSREMGELKVRLEEAEKTKNEKLIES